MEKMCDDMRLQVSQIIKKKALKHNLFIPEELKSKLV